MADAMKYIKESLSPRIDPINIRNYEEKNIEYIIEKHREIYEAEYGFSSEFRDYVEKYVINFMNIKT